MRTDELDFDLPPELIAQHPVTPRDSSRMMRYQRTTREVSHHVFRDLPDLLRRGDLLVFNDARVLPAKFTLIRPTGGRVGGLFLEEPRAGEWIALLKGLGPVRPEVVYHFAEDRAGAFDPSRASGASETSGDRKGAVPEPGLEPVSPHGVAPSDGPRGRGPSQIPPAGCEHGPSETSRDREGAVPKSEVRDQKSEISRKPESASGPLSRRERVVGVVAEGDRVRGDATARILEHLGEGRYRLLIEGPPAHELLDRIGAIPLPPYIHREHDEPEDRQRYQTVYAREPGSVAAPTAGLHFTPELLARLADRGIGQTSITLHVGLGTFRPISTAALEAHQMHAERYTLRPAAADAINAARREHRRVIAVGTTAARVLESQPAGRELEAHSGETSIFIRPGVGGWKLVVGASDSAPQLPATTPESPLPRDGKPGCNTGVPNADQNRPEVCVTKEADSAPQLPTTNPQPHQFDALLTNFHLPRSTLIALVAALVGLEEQRRLYRLAIEERYRFFSYGDAMLLE